MMLLELDDYERAFIEKKKEVTPDSELIILEILRLFDNCIKKALTSVDSATSSDDIKKLIDFMDRSGSYNQFYELWDKQLGTTIGRFKFTKRNLIHIFLPIFLEEIEGPLKKQLLLLDYLLELDKGRKVTWPEYIKRGKRHKYILEIVRDGIKLSDRYPEIRNVYSGLKADKTIFYINLVRKCIAHSDYRVEGLDDNLSITFPDPKGDFRLTFDQLCEIMTMTFDLILILHVAIHLGIRRKDSNVQQSRN